MRERGSHMPSPVAPSGARVAGGGSSKLRPLIRVDDSELGRSDGHPPPARPSPKSSLRFSAHAEVKFFECEPLDKRKTNRIDSKT